MVFPVLFEAITWNNSDILQIASFGTNFDEILIEIQQFSCNKMPLSHLQTELMLSPSQYAGVDYVYD